MATINNSPTLAEIKAIETDWNTSMMAQYNTIKAKYSDISIDDFSPAIHNYAPDVSDLHPTTGSPYVMGFNKKTLSNELIPLEAINGLKYKSYMVDATDSRVRHKLAVRTDHNGELHREGGIASYKLNDYVMNDVTIKGISTLVTENKVQLKTHDDGMKEIIPDWS